MKILMLTPYLPFPLVTGGQTRSYNLIKGLHQLGHEITLFCLVKKDSERGNIPELERFCKQVKVFKRPQKPWTIKNIVKTGFSRFPFLVIRNWAPGEKEAILKKLKEEDFDIIHAETFYTMPHIPSTNVPIVLVDQTIEFQVYQHWVNNLKVAPLRKFFQMDVKKIKFWELKYWKQAKKVIAMSEEDKKIMHSEIPGLNVGIVPNGVDFEWFSKKAFKKSKDPVLLYVGNFTWLQNREAAEVLINQIWPLIKKEVKTAKLWIIGKDAHNFFSDLKGEDVRVEQVSDIREAYQGAWVLVAPIYGGGGTRYKNFEAFASGLPVITTSIGIGGTDATNDKDVIIRDKPEQIAKEVVKLLQEESLRKRLAENARKMVKQRYDWKSITKALNDVYQEVVRD